MDSQTGRTGTGGRDTPKWFRIRSEDLSFCCVFQSSHGMNPFKISLKQHGKVVKAQAANVSFRLMAASHHYDLGLTAMPSLPAALS
jgi:hypothetical protein